MKKTLSIAIIATTVLGLGTLTSCQDEDFDVQTAVLKEKAFENGFVKEFGQPSANQSWDFYAQKLQGVRDAKTRATMAEPITCNVGTLQTNQELSESMKDMLDSVLTVVPEERYNYTAGQHDYHLYSVGKFKISAVRYAGGIEIIEHYNFDFGLAYTDETGAEHKVNLFGYHDMGGIQQSNFGNPKIAREVTLTEGAEFRFYLSYDGDNGNHYTYWSNVRPNDDYEGTSTLFYGTPEGSNTQVMVIGFEDMWEQGSFLNIAPDYDFNDIIIFIEGNLPEPSSKRFFAEDLASFDYDYNDVVFDVSNTGVTIRAVGGTLPVKLVITDKAGNKTTTDELHELMGANQVNQDMKNLVSANKVYYTDINGKPMYRPINVDDSKNGIKLEACRVPGMDWTAGEGNRLTKTEVEQFANTLAAEGEKIGDVKLLVGSAYGVNPTEELVSLDAGETTIIQYSSIGGIPSIWWAPVSVNWMQELTKITKGYQYFYGGKNPPSTAETDLWFNYITDKNTLYTGERNKFYPPSSSN